MEFESTMTATSGAVDEDDDDLDEAVALARGAVVGRFVLLGTLGAGGMGVVYAAHDPELDRKVALKLLLPRLGGTSDGGGRTRLVREAQALAKLSHPNVVAVHDVGTHGDSVWIAMEFVEGQTLSAWAEGRARRWTEVLPVLVDVARGVAAAHEAGLVHRDLKPDNVMLGRDGRVRVMDFGLAHGRGPAEVVAEATPGIPAGPESAAPRTTGPGLTMTLDPTAGFTSTQVSGTELASTLAAGMPRGSLRAGGVAVALGSRLTAVGAVQGTPAYMAPEQWMGREALPATDQFGWSVMAWELLYGEPPFVGETMASLSAAVTAGQRRPVPRGRAVPAWLRRVIERGLAGEPARRWPTMTALLAALEQGKRRARLGMAVGVVAGVALLGLGVAGYRRWDISQRMATCAAAGAEIDGVWNDGARQRLRDAFTATEVSDASATAERVLPWLDRQAAAWKQGRTEVCVNSEVQARWDADLRDRAVWCLEDRRIELTAVASEFTRATEMTLQRAVFVGAGLKAVDSCLNEDILRRQPAPPAHGRESIQEVHTKLSRADALSAGGEIKQALAVATEAREQAEAIDWPPLSAAAMVQQGYLLEKSGDVNAGEEVSLRAYFAAARAGAWDVAADAAIDLIYIVGHRQARHEEGRIWGEHAAMALAHAGDPLGLAEAERLNSLGGELVAMDEFAEARTMYERALAIGERVLGPEHPDVGRTLGNLGTLYMRLGELAEARRLMERTLASHEQSLGPDHPLIAVTLNNLAILDTMAGEFPAARARYERALASTRRVLGPDHPEVAGHLNNLANLLESTGAHAEALAMHQQALAITQKALGPEHPDAAQSMFNIATVHIATGAYAEAWTLLEQALAIQEKALGPDSLVVAGTLDSLGAVRLAQQRPQEALVLLRRAVALLEAHEGIQEGEDMAHFHLARAIVATGGDRAEALLMAQLARHHLREEGAGQARALAEVELWIGEQEGKP